MTGEFDPLDVKKVSESQKCAQSVLSSNERHIERHIEGLGDTPLHANVNFKSAPLGWNVVIALQAITDNKLQLSFRHLHQALDTAR